MTRVRALLLTGLFTAITTTGAARARANGATTPIATDRPGNGISPSTVPRRRLQLESSVAYSLDRASPDDTHLVSLPTLLRAGVLTFVELRLGSGLAGIDATPGASDRLAATDTSVGTKLHIRSSDGWAPSLGVVIDVYLPSGSGAFTGDVIVPEARVAASWSLPRGFGVLVNAGADVPSDASGRLARVVYVGNLSYAVFDGRLGFFVESFGRLAIASSQPAIAQLDAGLSALLALDWQLDLFTQHALSGAAPDFQVALGLSARF